MDTFNPSNSLLKVKTEIFASELGGTPQGTTFTTVFTLIKNVENWKMI
jgi:hypothetical protein